MSYDSKREQAFGLLSELCGGGDIPAEALRTASHTLFDVARHAGSETLYEVSRALPWMAAFVSLSSGDTSQNDVSNELFSRGALRALPPSAVTRRLREAAQATLRSPQGSVDGPVANALRDSARLDARLSSIVFRGDRDVRAAILDDAELLAAAVEICEEGESLASDARTRLGQLFPEWTVSDIRPRSRALRVLDGLESSWDGGIVARVAGFSERSRRFELSSVDHLRSNGYLVAVRAALAFAPVEDGGEVRDALERESAVGRAEPGVLRQFPAFRDDAPLEALALALIQMRGRVIGFLRGALPFAELSPWVDFLRGPCVELAESRDITIREATSFAHFTLHLLDFCDLVAFHRGAANDEVRRSMMGVEDELKEFALAYQREGLHDGASDLARFDETRWRSAEPGARLADRLARLRGCWREGSDSTPVGAPPRVDAVAFEHHLELLERLDEDAPLLEPLTMLLAQATIRGVRWLETLTADEIVGVLSVAAAAARDLPGIDPNGPWILDVEPLADWVNSDSSALRASLFGELLERTSVNEMVGGRIEPNTGGRGLVTRLTTRNDTVALEVDFTPDPELEAVLTLLSSNSDDAALRTVLRARLDAILAASVEDATQEVTLSPEVREELGI